LKVVCLDHPSYKGKTDYTDLNINTPRDIIYQTTQNIVVIIDSVKIQKVLFRDYYNLNNYEEYNPSAITFKPHSHGGYVVELQFDQQPQCYIDNECGNSVNNTGFYFITLVSTFLINTICNQGSSSGSFTCSIVHPQLPDFVVK